MSQKQQNLFDNSTKYFNLHEYIDRARTLPLLQEQLTYSTAGHLLETYVDALHVTLLADEQSFLIRLRDSPEKIRNPTFIRASHRAPPKYVIDALGNYLESPSFFVKHIVGEPGEPSRQDLKQPSATQFAHEVHGLLRQTGIKFTQKVTFNFYPPQGSGHELSKDNYHNLKRYNPEFAKKHFKEAIDSYKKLFQDFTKRYRTKNFSDPGNTPLQAATHMSSEQKNLVFTAFEASPELSEFNIWIKPIISKLQLALSPPALKSIFVIFDGDICQIDNVQLHPKFPFSTPALLLNALGYVGRHQIDRTFFPQQAFNFQLNVIGVESSVSDNIERLNQHISSSFNKYNRPLSDDILFPTSARKDFIDSIRTHQHGIQLLHLFHKTAGILEKIYPADKYDIAFQDMNQLLTLIGATTEVQQLNSPKEAATLIFAIERRLRATSKLMDATLYNSIGQLLNKAENLATKSNFSMIPQKLSNDIIAYLDLLENRDDISLLDKRALIPAMIAIKKSFIPT